MAASNKDTDTRDTRLGDDDHAGAGRQSASASILVVEDDKPLCELISRRLKAEGFRVEAVTTTREAILLLRDRSFGAVLCDVRLPGMSGLDLLRFVRLLDQQTTIVLTSGLRDVPTAVEAMKLGADDFLAKPFKMSEVLAALRGAMARRRATFQRLQRQTELETAAAAAGADEDRRERDFSALFLRSVRSLVHSLEAKDPYTRHHSKRVSVMGDRIASILGLGPAARQKVRLAGLLHDVGKIGVDKAVLHKRGPLNEEERRQIYDHPLMGERILKPMMARYPEIVLYCKHEHERWDGGGYPTGLEGEDIPIGARIIAVADCYDAVCSDRPYRKAQSHEKAMAILERNAGTQFDPTVVNAFTELVASGAAPPSWRPA